MSRNSIAIALVLALMTGIIVGQLTAVSSPSIGPRVRSSEHRLALVRAFYDGMNAYLETGDTHVLELLAPGFQDNGALGAEPGSADALLTRLDRLRMSVATPKFRIEELHDLGQLIQVRLSTGLSREQEAASFSAMQPSSARSLEFLRLQGDAIVTRWAQDDLIPVIDLVATDEALIATPGTIMVEIDRVSLDPGARLELNITHDAWILVERGRIAIASGSAGIELSRGELHPFRQEATERITNLASQASSIWLIGAMIERAYQPPLIDDSDSNLVGITVDVRIGPNVVLLSPGTVRIRTELALLTVPPGTQLIPLGDAMRRVLVVSQGAVEASIQEGDLLHTSQSGISTSVRERQLIAAGEGATMLPDAFATYRSAGASPADVFLMTLTQID